MRACKVSEYRSRRERNGAHSRRGTTARSEARRSTKQLPMPRDATTGFGFDGHWTGRGFGRRWIWASRRWIWAQR